MNLRDVPIQRKLRFVILATCAAALCVSSTALFALQYLFFKRDYKRDLESVAEIVSSLSGPAISLGGGDATETFLKALHAKPHIVGASIVLNDGSTAASTGWVEQKLQAEAPAADGFHTIGDHLIYVHPIFDDTNRVGTLFLVSDYRKRSIHLHTLYAGILVAVLASSVFIAVIISSRLERVICGPIQTLADTARRIATKSDYSLRARKEANDEVGEFTDTFNGMLSQIQERDAALRHEIAERRRAEEEVARVHQQLMDASRAAGMAEVATDVLHNVGNVLNSVNVSATIISEKLGTARTANLARAAQFIREKNGTVAQYLSDDPKGQLLPGYLVDATDQLARDQSEALSELQLLTQNIEHIKDIVAMQQSYARVSGLLEPMPMDVLIEDAIRMNAGALERHQVGLVRNFSDVPPAIVDKPKVLQILVNLLRNAKYAMDEGGTSEKCITVRLRQESDTMLAVDISDTGAGILAENLTRVFSHGFTTRRDGHGFGLHSAAIAAKEMGGSLTVTSAGLNRGATFTLLLTAAPAADSSTAEATTAQFHA